jgi:hypothetical protein
MIRLSLAALLVTASASFAFAATDEELRQQIVGAWGQDDTCSTGSLSFAADGTFVFARPGFEDQSGTWSIAGGVLSGARSDGSSQPDATVAFADGKMTMAESGSAQAATFFPCPS